MEKSLSIKIDDINMRQDYWLTKDLTLKNTHDFFKFLIVYYREYDVDLLNIYKKFKKGNKSTLSLIFIFSRTITNSKQAELKVFLRKIIQIIMDNPKKFRR